MKVVILAGGLGTRLSEETDVRPKPMVEIGGHPILWHIMKHYAFFDHREFVIALGYKGQAIKRFFLEYHTLSSDLTIQLATGEVKCRNRPIEDWTVNLVETGLNTMTGGRLKRLASFLADGTFMLTYGDGVSDVDLPSLIEFHRSHGKLATVTAVRPPARYGGLRFDGDQVIEFTEKPQIGEGWINGGFFVLEPAAIDYIQGDATHWEREPLENLALDGELMAYRHHGFWQSMDTLRDRRMLDERYRDGKAPWKLWQE